MPAAVAVAVAGLAAGLAADDAGPELGLAADAGEMKYDRDVGSFDLRHMDAALAA